MAVAIKRVIQFSHAKMNSVQSEQTRIRAKNKYKNDHICEEFKKFNLHPINNIEVYITILKTAVLWQIVRQLWK